MKALILALSILGVWLVPIGTALATPNLSELPKQSAVVYKQVDCNKKKLEFFGIPTWYKYLKFDENCSVVYSFSAVDDKGGIADSNKIDFKVVWLIALAVVEGLLVISGIVAFIFVLVGGFQFITAQGAPDAIAKARKTILNALIGGGIAIIGSQVVAFIAENLK